MGHQRCATLAAPQLLLQPLQLLPVPLLLLSQAAGVLLPIWLPLPQLLLAIPTRRTLLTPALPFPPTA